ncbi:nuclear transport factor 2 family protein [Uliginosibacterium sp. 31-12]|uniref:nuclear transport factor 2 family protein n=1 Tax=Uliginosibacterium sp. 31-12 TaxID=3062781 RepID=UPI0026E2DE26|nr:nuclear transport factor 2 family protein [Uliginosibacterium sp. 31-12]MDO6387748.1 nuclear transport factor 2 family protein [Uliginosibacterium sp. 31-12]
MKTNLQIVTEHYAASARQDLAAMMADVSPEVAWTEMAGFPCAGTWIGPDQVIANVFAVLDSEWEGYSFALEQIIDGGEQLVGIGTYSGTYRKTGKPMQARVTHVWRLSEGKIVRFEQFTDTLLVARAMHT